MSEARKLPAPEATPETQPFWDAAREGRLLIKRCGGCGEAHYPPRGPCPFCHAPETAWEEAKGTGSVYSFSVMRRGPGAPYAIGYVELDEGPRMLTNIVAGDGESETADARAAGQDGNAAPGSAPTAPPASLAIGDRVCLTFTETEEGGAPVPFFTPAGSSSS
ncbi:MAG: Zn-ribbon domain-containing OB-fold protein [Parasphingopyxis sp.]